MTTSPAKLTPEAVRSLQHAANKRLTPFQKQIMTELRCGHTLRVGAHDGWYYKKRYIKSATKLALWRTGELAQVRKCGSVRYADLIVHQAFEDLSEYEAAATALPSPFPQQHRSPSDTDTDDSNRR
jgi:hypothetical protein